MTFREKSTVTLITMLTVVFGWYVALVARELRAAPVDDIVYQGPLAMAVVVLIVLLAVTRAAVAMAAADEAGDRDAWQPARPAPRRPAAELDGSGLAGTSGPRRRAQLTPLRSATA